MNYYEQRMKSGLQIPPDIGSPTFPDIFQALLQIPFGVGCLSVVRSNLCCFCYFFLDKKVRYIIFAP